MNMIQFYEWFPEVSETETVTISLTKGDAGRYRLPAAQYFCIEQICPNPECDCQEVALSVVGDHFGRPLAYLRVKLKAGHQPHVAVDESATQSQYCDQIVRLVSDRLHAEPRLAAQFNRHYRLVKKRAAHETSRRKFLAGS